MSIGEGFRVAVVEGERKINLISLINTNKEEEQKESEEKDDQKQQGTRFYENLVEASKLRELLAIVDSIRDASAEEIIFVSLYYIFFFFFHFLNYLILFTYLSLSLSL